MPNSVADLYLRRAAFCEAGGSGNDLLFNTQVVAAEANWCDHKSIAIAPHYAGSPGLRLAFLVRLVRSQKLPGSKIRLATEQAKKS